MGVPVGGEVEKVVASLSMNACFETDYVYYIGHYVNEW